MLTEERCTELVSSSGGNAGLAVAYAAASWGVPSRVFLPTTTPVFMRKRIESMGATVTVKGQVCKVTTIEIDPFQ